MKISIKTPALALIAIASGAIVLLGYFLQLSPLQSLRSMFLNWAMVLGAVALGVGVINLIRVHLHKLRLRSSQRVYSIVLLVSLGITFLVAVVFGLTSSLSLWIYDYILIPVETSLVAILVILLVYALVRMFYRGVTASNLVFALTAFFILGATALLAWVKVPLVGELRNWINQVWSLAGARAILIGVALGAIAAGLRVLIGADRPYES